MSARVIGCAAALVLLMSIATATLAAPGDDETDLGDAIRTFNEAFGDAVAGEMTDAQIDRFETLLAPAFDADKVHANQCGLVAMAATIAAGNIMAGTANPALSVMAEETRRGLVPGSFRHWLVDFASALLPQLGVERTTAATRYQCTQMKYLYAMYSDLPMDSVEMDAAEICLLEQDC
ncbi:MAG: hypothetical protein AAGI15_05130 [Pseudomonadota bacterium]